MALIHLEANNKALVSERANGTLYEGDPVVRDGDGAHTLDAATDDRCDGIVVNLRGADNIAEHEYDYQPFGEFAFEGDGGPESDRVPIGMPEPYCVLLPYTIDDDTLPAPQITRNDVVGVAAIAGQEGKVVEEGYSDDGGTTVYEEGNGNFVPLGRAEIGEGETFDEYGALIRLRVRD